MSVHIRNTPEYDDGFRYPRTLEQAFGCRQAVLHESDEEILSRKRLLKQLLLRIVYVAGVLALITVVTRTIR